MKRDTIRLQFRTIINRPFSMTALKETTVTTGRRRGDFAVFESLDRAVGTWDRPVIGGIGGGESTEEGQKEGGE